MLHKFEFDGDKLVLDVHSGTLHQVDTLAWELLDDINRLSHSELLNKYQARYDLTEIEEAVAEIKQLIAQGLLFSDDPLKGTYDKPKGVVKALCLHVAHDCNLRCQYCFAGQGPFGGDRSLMSEEVGRAAIDFLIKKSENRRHIEVDFFGGEPTLNFNVVQKLVDYGRQKAAEADKEIKFTLTTNAVLLDEEKQQYLLDNNINVILSLDGRPEVHDKVRANAAGCGSYRQVIKNIQSMVQKKPPAGYYVRGTFTRHNLDFSKDIMHMVEKGFTDISVEPVVADPKEEYALKTEDLPVIKEEYRFLTRKFLQLYKQGKPVNFFHFNIDLDGGPCLPKRLTGCGAGNEYLAVTPNGDLYPCHQFVGISQFKVGNVFNDELNEAVTEQFRQAHIYTKQGCSDCWAKYYCSGGCNANAYFSNHDILKPYRLGCELAKIRLECALYLQAKKLELNL